MPCYEEKMQMDVATFFEKHKPDYVIHLAANVGGLFKNMEYPVQMLEDNLLINMNQHHFTKLTKKWYNNI